MLGQKVVKSKSVLADAFFRVANFAHQRALILIPTRPKKDILQNVRDHKPNVLHVWTG